MSNMLRKIERNQFRLIYGKRMGAAWRKRAEERRAEQVEAAKLGVWVRRTR